MKMSAKANIVLLATDSRESQLKAQGYTKAAHALGLRVKAAPDRNTLAVIPTSDYKAVEAAWSARNLGIPGPDPIAITVAFNKSLAYEFLKRRGFPILEWFFPLHERDLLKSSLIQGPIIVKPECGSGSYSHYPWGYRKFISVSALHRYLKKHGWLDSFFKLQAEPQAFSGRFMVMEYVPGPIFSVGAALGEAEMGVFVRKEVNVPAGNDMNPDRMTFGVKNRITDSIEAWIRSLQEFGLKRSSVFVQCVVREGVAYPIDINLRPGNAIAKFSSALELPLHEEILGCVLGLKDRFEFRLPKRYVQLRRWMLPIVPGQAKVHFPDGAVPLVDEYFYDPQKPYDRSYARPLFAVLSNQRRNLDSLADRVISSTWIEEIKQ